jgi:hypothetical protein
MRRCQGTEKGANDGAIELYAGRSSPQRLVPDRGAIPGGFSVSQAAAVYKSKELWKTIRYFLMLQSFFAAMILSFSLGGKAAFGILIAIPPLMAWLAGKRKSFRFILYFICVAFVVGQRTLYLGHARIVPSEILLWFLAFSCLFVKSEYRFRGSSVPMPVIILFIASVFGILIAVFAGFNPNAAFSYAKGIWLALPAFFVVRKLVTRMEHVKTILTIISLAALFLCFLGVSEYYNLPFVKLFAGYIDSHSRLIETGEGFRRAGATFWGGASMALMIVIFFPVMLAHWYNARTLTEKIILSASLVLSVLFIYFSGYRGLWVTLCAALGLYFYLKGIKGIMVLFLVLGLLWAVTPDIAKQRIQTLHGKKADSSALKHEARAVYVVELIQRSPVLGNGWGASGLSHTDVLQVWADSGLAAFLSFLAIFFGASMKMMKILACYGDKRVREYAYGFAVAPLVILMVLSHQAFFNLPEQYPPMWITIALAWQYPYVLQIEKKLLMQKNPTSKEPHHA